MPPMEDDENKKLTDWLTQTEGGNTAVQAPQPQTPATPEAAPTDKGSAEESENTTDNNDERIQDSHPGHQPEDLAGYVKGQEAQIDKYGPEQEKAVINNILQSQGSAGNRAARGFAGLGDAIMGVAGKTGPGFLNSLENREQNQNKMALESIPQLQGMNEKNMAAKQALEGLTSTSPLGASQTPGITAILKQLGIPDSEIPKIVQNPAAAKAILEPMVTYGSEKEKTKAAMILKEIEVAQQQAQLAATVANQKAVLANTASNESMQRQQEQERLGEENTKIGLEHPVAKFFGQVPNVGGGQSTSSQRIAVISPDGKIGHIPAGQLKAALAKGYKQQ
jgi:hypothetical protein